MKQIATRIGRVNYRHLICDALLIAVSLYGSLFLRVDGRDLRYFLPTLHSYLIPFVLLRLGVLVAFGVYDIIWRYVSLDDAARLGRAVVASAVGLVALSYIVPIGRLPRAVFFIDAALIGILLAGVRIVRRIVFEGTTERLLAEKGRRTLLIGAGANGRALESRFRTDSCLGFRIIGFIDDDPRKIGRLVGGIKVLGPHTRLSDLIRDYAAIEVIVAIAHPSGELLRNVVHVCRQHGIRPRLIASANVAEPKKTIELVREIEFSDLLARPSRSLDLSLVEEAIRGRRVLITGAGGSIGSELCRQILRFSPSSLILVDHSEFNLYQIDQELSSSNDTRLVVPVLADIKEPMALKTAFREHLPEVVFHAAAYKHVHLVEHNPLSSILNNIGGTANVLALSDEFDVKSFVLISTDKAVNPGGVMGATKRACELLVAELGLRKQRSYCAVRFGNVLGSSGSLIPLLKAQIENREPVTITHQDMTRYFMLIPEAVSLVLRAATLAKPGDIAILRMGEPIRIVDLARSLMALMGRAEDEVPIVYTGVRPGEKFFEELYICGDELETEDPDILVLPAGDGRWNLQDESLPVGKAIEEILELARAGNSEAVFRLSCLVKSRTIRETAAAHKPGPKRLRELKPLKTVSVETTASIPPLN